MCLTPITIKNKRTNEDQSVPCGKCPKCLSRRVSGWSFRLMQEDKISSSSHFVTLTYDPESLPISKHGRATLRKRDIQLFFKRLRKVNDTRIKYYCAGEYGTQGWRPHYHVILFNCNPDTIAGAWGHGSIDIGTVSAASVGYTLKYMSKPHRVPQYAGDDRVPEFSLMSKNWGLTILRMLWLSGTKKAS